MKLGAIRQLIVYDGVCGLCNRFVLWSLDHIAEPDTGFVSSQSHIGQQLLKKHKLPTDPSTVYLFSSTGVSERSDAVIQLMYSLRSPYRQLVVLRWIPRAMRDLAYRLVAKIRRWIPSKTTVCGIDHPNQNLLLDAFPETVQEDWLKKYFDTDDVK